MTDHTEAPRIEVTIAAPVEQVWRALRDPELIRRWHGYDFDGLDEEVRVIFVDDVTEDPGAHVLIVDGGDRFSLHPVSSGTVVRVTRAPYGSSPEWDAYYDDITEGWTTFLQHLRFGIERHGLAERRTLLLDGALADAGSTLVSALGLAEAADLPTGTRYSATLATGDQVEGAVYTRTEHQRGFTVEGFGAGLLMVARLPASPERPQAKVQAILTTYDLPGPDFAEIERRWLQWWDSVRAVGTDQTAPAT